LGLAVDVANAVVDVANAVADVVDAVVDVVAAVVLENVTQLCLSAQPISTSARIAPTPLTKKVIKMPCTVAGAILTLLEVK
jgi:hypothetical protein